MNEILTFIKDFWEVLLLISGGIGSFLKWKSSQRKSTEMLYDELEKLKQKVILQVSKEIEQATELAEKQRILLSLQQHCPECYREALKNIQNEEDKGA